jgi:HAD superfamily hydrolase (TIGR01549 family)
MERAPEERARVSAAVLRTFLNIADRWELPSAYRLALLQCNAAQFDDWSMIARSNGPLVLETDTLMRISAILGLFADLQQLFATPDQQRDWLFSVNKAAPFKGRTALDLLGRTLDDQLAVRGYVAAKRWGGGEAPNAIDENFTPYTDKDLIWTDARPQIKAVCFDGFGTLVEIGDKRRPFRALLSNAPSSKAATQVLTTPMSLRDLADSLATITDEARLAELEADLAAETASTRHRPGIDAMWSTLRQLGLKIGVCSNLAAPYANALLDCLPGAPDAVILSFEVGLMKPQPEIYQIVCNRLDLKPHQVLFVGDSIEADVIGPRNAGLFALHINEFEAGIAQGTTPGAPKAVNELLARAAIEPSHP